MRQPKLTHKKRKLLLSPNKTYMNEQKLPHTEFAFLSNSYNGSMTIKRVFYSLVLLVQFSFSFVWLYQYSIYFKKKQHLTKKIGLDFSSRPILLEFIERMKGISDTPQAESSRRASSGFRPPRANPMEPSQSFIRTNKKAPKRVLVGADEGTRTHMVSHRNLKPARLPVSPHPHSYNGLPSVIFFLL